MHKSMRFMGDNGSLFDLARKEAILMKSRCYRQRVGYTCVRACARACVVAGVYRLCAKVL
jgi:hypothetical protein